MADCPNEETCLPLRPLTDNSHLCQTCRGMSIANLDEGLHHHSSYKALQASSKSCPLCSLILGCLVPHEDESRDFESCEYQELSPNGGVFIRFSYSTRSSISYGGMKDYSELVRIEARNLKGYLRVYAHKENEMASVVMGRPVKVKEGGWRDYNLVHEWILGCIRDHPECRKRGAMLRDLPLPTRVIDIKHIRDERIRLLTSNGRKGKWITLSHCWGLQGFPKLTTKNINEMHKSIPLLHLPKTFQDTIKLAATVGIRYIWIDALCIIQDSPTDWDRESSQMPSIYANSSIAIAAAASADCHGGFMKHTCPEAVLQGCNLHLSPTKEIWFAPRIDNRVPQPRQSVPFDRSILDGRAWCLQERVLSPRLLTFLPREMTWTCKIHIRESTSREEGEYGMLSMLIIQSFKLSERLNHRHFNREAITLVYWIWYREILEDYTSRALTYPSDKLVAIAGIARLIQNKAPDEYLAGLWRRSLPLALLWQAPHEIKGSNMGNGSPRMVREPLSVYRAPSWSWASLDGRITFYNNTEGVAKHDGEYGSDTFLSMLEAQITPLGFNPLGQVKDGFLRVHGPLQKFICGEKMHYGGSNALDWSWTYDVPEMLRFKLESMGPNLPQQTGAACLFDTVEPAVNSVIWCLRITEEHGLILAPTGKDAEFKRVGLFELGARRNLESRTHFRRSLEDMSEHPADEQQGPPRPPTLPEPGRYRREYLINQLRDASLFEDCLRTITII